LKVGLVGLFVVGVIALGWLGLRGSTLQGALAVVFFLCGSVLLLRFVGIRLFGPVLVYDLVRSSRRDRHFARIIYTLTVLSALLWTYMAWLGDPLGSPPTLPTKTLAQFASSFVATFMVIQVLAVFALTPAYTAGVISQERQRGTLDALLATDLWSHEIVLSMLLSRLAHLLLLLAAGLPILSLTLLWGGVDPELLLMTFAATGLTMISLGCLSILVSVRARRPRQAIVFTYLIVAGYLIVTGLGQLWMFYAPTFGWGSWLDRILIRSADPLTVRDVLESLCIGNPFVLLAQALKLLGAAGRTQIWSDLRNYGLFHMLIALGCVIVAVVRLRPLTRRMAGGTLQEAGAENGRRIKKPRWSRLLASAVGRGMLWKETVVEERPARGTLGWLWLGVRVAVLFWLAIHICFHLGRWLPAAPESRLAELMNMWVRLATVLMGCFMLLQVAARAASSFSGERDRHTLEALLASPLENRTLLFTKWLGSILSVRGAWFRLGIVWVVGILMGAMHPMAAPCLLLAWFVYAAFLASLGLLFSVTSHSTQRALVWTLLTALGIGLALGIEAYRMLDHDWKLPLAGYALVPAVLLGLLAFSPQEYHQWSYALIILPAELFIWALAAGGLYALAGNRFRALTGRVSLQRLLFAARQWGTPAIAPPADGHPSITALPPAPLESNESASIAAPSQTISNEDEWQILPQGRRWPRHLLNALLFLLPLAMLSGAYAYLADFADRDLLDAVAQVEGLDPTWRLEEIEARRPTVPEDRNSALQVMKTRALLPQEWDTKEVDAVMENQPSPELRLRPRDELAVRNELGKLQAALIEARRLCDLPRGRFPVDWSRDGISTNLGHLNQVRTVARLLDLDVMLRAQESDTDGALLSCQGMVNVARSTGDEPTMISLLLRNAILQLSLAKIERVLAQGEPSDLALAALQELLEEEDRQLVLLQALQGERALVNRFFEALRMGDGNVAQVLGSSPHHSLDRWLTEMLGPLIVGSLKEEQAYVLRLYTQMVEAAKLPPEQQDAAFRACPRPTRTHLLASMLFPAVARIASAYRREQAQVRCALMALAVERYRRQHGRWPASLAEVVPSQLRNVPLDPYDGLPLRYRRLSDGVVIYSVGPDGIDDGGKLDRKNIGAAGTDLGLRLWDADKRRQPPREPPIGSDPTKPAGGSW